MTDDTGTFYSPYEEPAEQKLNPTEKYHEVASEWERGRGGHTAKDVLSLHKKHLKYQEEQPTKKDELKDPAHLSKQFDAILGRNGGAEMSQEASAYQGRVNEKIKLHDEGGEVGGSGFHMDAQDHKFKQDPHDIPGGCKTCNDFSGPPR